MLAVAIIALMTAGVTKTPTPAELRAMTPGQLREHYAPPPFRIQGVRTDAVAVAEAAEARCSDDIKCRADFIAGFERLKADWARAERKGAVERYVRAATKATTDWQLAADRYEAEFPLVTDPDRVEARYRADRASVRRHCEKVLAPMGDPVASSATTLEACIDRELAARRRLDR